METRDSQRPLVRGTVLDDSVKILGDVVIEKGSYVWFGSVIRGDPAKAVRIGKDSVILENCFIEGSEIGNNVLVGHGSILHKCKISDGVLVGIGAIVLDDAEVGKDCIIGAGSVVIEGTRVKPNSLVAGVPARLIRELKATSEPRFSRELVETKEKARYYMKRSACEKTTEK